MNQGGGQPLKKKTTPLMFSGSKLHSQTENSHISEDLDAHRHTLADKRDAVETLACKTQLLGHTHTHTEKLRPTSCSMCGRAGCLVTDIPPAPRHVSLPQEAGV